MVSKSGRPKYSFVNIAHRLYGIRFGDNLAFDYYNLNNPEVLH